MFDCWKKSCQGATVVSTMEMIRSTEVELYPPCTPGVTKPLKKDPALGWLMNASGTTRKLTTMKTNMNRSQRRKLPDAVIAMRPSAAMGTEMYSLTPKYPR